MSRFFFRFPQVRSVLGVSIFFLSVFILLQGLGFWQLWRLEWKEALLERVEVRRSESPMLLDGALGLEDLVWRRVILRGMFVHDFERHILTSVRGGAGWRIVTPFLARIGDSDLVVLVDRGVVPLNLKLRSRRLAHISETGFGQGSGDGVISVTGFIVPPARGGFFSPVEDLSANIWHWHDVSGMVSSLGGFFSDKDFFPFIVHAAPGFDGWGSDFFPRRDDPVSDLHNRHFGYAVTWFSLSLIALIFWYVLCFSRFRLEFLRAR